METLDLFLIKVRGRSVPLRTLGDEERVELDGATLKAMVRAAERNVASRAVAFVGSAGARNALAAGDLAALSAALSQVLAVGPANPNWM